MEKSLIVLSFLTSLFINWTGLLGILGARDRREVLVQERYTLDEKEVIREYLSKQDSVLEDVNKNCRIFEGLVLEGHYPIPTALLWAGLSRGRCGCLGTLMS